jgi:phage repressor protein C with HTH and peptisase S24 domain
MTGYPEAIEIRTPQLGLCHLEIRLRPQVWRINISVSSGVLVPQKQQTSECSRRILGLRKSLGLTQAALASRLQYSAMALSRWERGTHEPTAEGYVRLANLAPDSERSWFWTRAGVIKEVPKGIAAKLETANIRLRANLTPQQLAQIPLVPISILEVSAAAPGALGDSVADLDGVAPLGLIAAPAKLFPNPENTKCLRVKGDSMSPTINDGDFVAVDVSQTDPTRLGGKIIVTWHKGKGLMISRFLLVGTTHLLTAENWAYEPVVCEQNRKWRIVGRVLWWIGYAR